jgi:hypothetical protein
MRRVSPTITVLTIQCALVGLILSTAPAFAQDTGESEELIARGVGVFGVFSSGNLALRDIARNNDPVERLKRFFSDAKLPLTSGQEEQLNAIVDSEVRELEAAGEDAAGVRRINVEYNRRVNAVLISDQRAELRRYRAEQIMLNGGFPVLKLILENGNAPLSPDQEKQAQGLYLDFNRLVGELPKDSNGRSDRTKLAALASEKLGKVVSLLTPEQRRALAAARQGTLSARVRP